MQSKYDAVIVGSGPNGLSAGVELARRGLQVLIIEGKDLIGGGTRTLELTLPGFHHDVCSAIHPMAPCSPFFSTLPLDQHGLKWIMPPCAVAHPFDDGSSAFMYPSVDQTAESLGEDAAAYRKTYGPLMRDEKEINAQILGPMVRFPKYPGPMMNFGLKAIQPATQFVKRFRTKHARGLFAGMAAHTTVDLSHPATTAVALSLTMGGHINSWPIAAGGSKSISAALASYFKSLGGEIQTGRWIKSIDELPSARAIIFDLSPRQIARIAGNALPASYSKKFQQWKYGPGVCKIDLALSGPIPWTNKEILKTATAHLGGTFEEIAQGEKDIWEGKHVERPFVLLAQQSLFDPSRAPAGKHTCWAYCHVPNGSTKDMSDVIIAQIERYAPGVRDLIIGKHVMTAVDYENYNPNFIGGDIIGGAFNLMQVIGRPLFTLDPYYLKESNGRGMYICSASAAPGAGIHGMPGLRAAQSALRHTFR